MKYLIKDLVRLTGIPASRIRKWQERYRFLHPKTGENGYKYYDQEDLFKLKQIGHELAHKKTISTILKELRLDSDPLFLRQEPPWTLSEIRQPTQGESIPLRGEELRIIEMISSGNFTRLADILDGIYSLTPFPQFVQQTLSPLLVLVGRAWENRLLTVADEHAMSRFFTGYVYSKIQSQSLPTKPTWLVVTFPGEVHELGALLHYSLLLHSGISARYCGNLPENELMKELTNFSYKNISISIVIRQDQKKIELLRLKIAQHFPQIEIHWGGPGYLDATSSPTS